MDDLESFLKGNEQPVAETETPAQPETTAAPEVTSEPVAEEPKGPVRDEKGRFAPKGETETAPPAAEEPQHSIPPKALQEERRKRQELEAKIAEYEARLNQPQTPPPTIWEDEQGWQQHFGGQVVSEAVQAATLNARLDMSEMMVRQAHPDFEDKKAAFLDLMNEMPGLREKALGDPHPWQFAYNYVANHQRMNELAATNVAELEAKIEARIRAEFEAKQQPAAPAIPDSLADAQSARGSSVPFTPPTLDEILRR